MIVNGFSPVLTDDTACEEFPSSWIQFQRWPWGADVANEGNWLSEAGVETEFYIKVNLQKHR